MGKVKNKRHFFGLIVLVQGQKLKSDVGLLSGKVLKDCGMSYGKAYKEREERLKMSLLASLCPCEIPHI